MMITDKKKNLCLDILFLVFTAIICIWNLKDINYVRVVDDGFVYWGIGAAFAGYDWKDLLSVSQYYAYGYSILLVPLFWLTKLGVSMTAIYRIAILLNIFFVWGNYLLSCKILKELEVRLPDTVKQIASGLAALYIGNVIQINFAWTECCLYFVYWLIVYLMVKVCKKPDYKHTFFLLLSLAYIVMVHMRAVGVVIAAAMVLVLYILSNFRNLNKKWIGFVLIESAVLALITAVLRKAVTASVYLGGTAVESTNNVSANLEKTQSLLSVSGILDLVMSMLGKLYYAGTASFVLAFVGAAVAVFALVKKVLQRWKEKEKFGITEWAMLFVLLSFLGENGISAIFKCFRYFSADAISARGDTIVFGRYSDFVIGPMILLGIYALYHIKEYVKEIFTACLFLVVCAVSVQFQYNVLAYYGRDAYTTFRDNSSYWVGALYQQDLTYFAYYVAFVSLLIFGVLCFLVVLNKEKKYLYGIGLTVVAVAWGIAGIKNSADFIEEKKFKEKDVVSVYNIVNETDGEVPVYLAYHNNREAFIDVKVLQWMLGERPVKLYEIGENEPDNLKDAVILCDSYQPRRMAMLSDDFEYLYNSGTIALFMSRENPFYEEVSAKALEMQAMAAPGSTKLNLADLVTEYSYVRDNGDLYYNYQASGGAYLTGDMGVALSDGTYEFAIDVRIKDCVAGSDVGYITIGDNQGNIQDTYVIKADDFMNADRQTIRVPVEIKGIQTPFIGFYTYGEAAIRIFDISYEKIKNNMAFSSETIEPLLVQVPENARICYVDTDGSSKTGFPEWQSGRMEYLSVDMIGYKENFDADYYLFEKTDEVIAGEVFEGMEVLKEDESFILFKNFAG